MIMTKETYYNDKRDESHWLKPFYTDKGDVLYRRVVQKGSLILTKEIYDNDKRDVL